MVLNPKDLSPIPLGQWLATVETFPVEALPSVLDQLPAESPARLHRGHPATEVAGLLTAVHTTGTRRPALVSLAGYLRYRGVAEEIAVALLLPWARDHFDPPLEDAEVERHVRGIYHRYGLGRRSIPTPVDPDDIVRLDTASDDVGAALSEVWG